MPQGRWYEEFRDCLHLFPLGGSVSGSALPRVVSTCQPSLPLPYSLVTPAVECFRSREQVFNQELWCNLVAALTESSWEVKLHWDF